MTTSALFENAGTLRRMRLLAAQSDSLARAHATLPLIGKCLAHRDVIGTFAAMNLTAAHYRNAGEATLAAHWQNRANSLNATYSGGLTACAMAA